jgi:hypothetical protein
MIELRESDIKATCESFLYSLMNMDKLIYLRLNSGDLIIGEIDRGIYNIFVEYKRPVGGKQTREQLAFEKKVEGMGFEYWIVKDSEAFVEAIREII